MREGVKHSVKKLVEYDGLRRRLWILGQLCHHGATGSIVAATAFVALVQGPEQRLSVGHGRRRDDGAAEGHSCSKVIGRGGADRARPWWC